MGCDDDQDGYCSDEIFVDMATRKKTCQSFTCISPLFILSRWLNSRKNSRKRLKKVVNNEEKKMIGDKNGVDSDEAGKDSSFNLGLGFGLLYLIAVSRNMKIEADNNNNKQLCVSSSSSNTTNNSHRKKEGDNETLLSSRNLTLKEIVFGMSSFRRQKSLRMDQLEAELKAEFDRFQLHTENKEEANFSEVNIEDCAPEESSNTEEEEAMDDHDEFYSVPAIELERKLHELLEERQEEKINELEMALEFAVEEIQERERELIWWRNTARFVCKNLPDIRDMVFFQTD